MPMRELAMYAEMLPQLDAEQSLVRATEIAAGSGTLKDGAAVLRDWRDRAAGGGAPSGSRTSGFESLALLQAANERARAEGTLPQQHVTDGGAD